MFDSICHIHPVTVDAGLFQALVQQLSCRAHKWAPLQVFAISRLLAHDKYGNVRLRRKLTAFDLSKYRLRSVTIQIASAALLYCRCKHWQGMVIGDKRGGAGSHLLGHTSGLDALRRTHAGPVDCGIAAA